MINKLKRRFTLLSLAALLVLLAFIVVGMNLLNYNSLVDEADEILTFLSENQGVFPEYGLFNWLPHGWSPELPFESRYFSVLVDNSGRVLSAETSSITAVDAVTALEYAARALNSRSWKGFIDDYRYEKMTSAGRTRVTFLDCGRRLEMFRDFAVYSVIMSLAGYALIAVAVILMSGRVTRPAAESYDKQKRFITDASHEIKTPLTIISANVDVLRMDQGENECLDEIQKQTVRLTELTRDLVYLSRMEESGSKPQMIELPLSDTVSEAAASFRQVALSKNAELEARIEPMLSLTGDQRAISQLVDILLDNAVKYTPEGGRISLTLERQGKKTVLTVTNTVAAPIDPESLRHVFERFYRADASRNSETGGHGIGLAMAEAIVNAHGGRIAASAPDGGSFRITVVFTG